MIAVDTSALVAIALAEPRGVHCLAALEDNAASLLISAGTCAEARIVAAQRNISEDIANLLQGYGWRIIPVTSETAIRIETVYRKWGKNFHRASLNFGDCFAYDVARQNDCPLLYIGNDFALTDIASAI